MTSEEEKYANEIAERIRAKVEEMGGVRADGELLNAGIAYVVAPTVISEFCQELLAAGHHEQAVSDLRARLMVEYARACETAPMMQ